MCTSRPKDKTCKTVSDQIEYQHCRPYDHEIRCHRTWVLMRNRTSPTTIRTSRYREWYKTSRSSSTTLYARPTQDCTSKPTSTGSTGRIVVHNPLQNQGVQPQRLRRCILWWPKLQEYRCRGESMQVFSWQESSYLTMSTWRPQYTGRPDHCECRPANHLAPTVNARF